MAVDAVNFSLQERELRCLIGPNGAGKSTFFKCLTGQYRLTHENGRVLIRGTDVIGLAHARDRAARCGHQDAGTLGDERAQRAGEPVALRAPHSRLGRSRRRGASEVTAELRLGEILRRQVGELSHGQRQMVEIGIVLVQRPWLGAARRACRGHDRRRGRDA